MAFLSPFERTARRSRWLSYATAVLAMLFFYWLAARLFGRLIGFLIVLPMLASGIAWLLVNHASAGFRGLRWLALHKVNGRFHAFDDLEVAVVFRNGQCQVAALDVFNVMRESLDAPTLRRLVFAFGARGFFQDADGEWWFGEAALLDWLGNRARRFDERALRFRHWFERDVFPPLRRKSGAFNPM